VNPNKHFSGASCPQRVKEVIMRSYDGTIADIQVLARKEELSYSNLLGVLNTFYKERSIEIISQIDSQGLMLDDDIKIGGTD
jgi:hypothetical protein